MALTMSFSGMAGAQDTIYLCNFRVSVDGEWLCLKELQDFQPELIPSYLPKPPYLHYTYERDPMQVERTNLVNLCKLIVKELIDSSLKYGRMLDSDYVPLQHFFIVLEHVFRHGLRPKKGLLGPKKELWDLLQLIEKYCPDAADITASIRDLPSVKTHMGRARAWLRLALMQKKIADYLKVLLDHRDDVMSEFFEIGALLMSDEAVIIMGLLLGLNVIDCNICIKGEDLDSQQGVIDFSLYLRNGSGDATPPANNIDNSSMTAVLDQKNYVEELNRHLTATVSNLQARVESLTTTNALMKEDLSLTKTSLAALQQENAALKTHVKQDRHNVNLETDSAVQVNLESPPKATAVASVITEDVLAEIKLQLAEEKNRRLDLEKELEIQTSMRAETEVALKLLEKDIHEKQDTIVSLRRQLDDIKLINLEMYRKLQECEASLKLKSDTVAKLEASVATLTESVKRLDSQLLETEKSKKEAEDAAVVAHESAVTANMRLGTVEADLRVEREWREALQETAMVDKEKIVNLQEQLLEAEKIVEEKDHLRAELNRSMHQCAEQEQTMEELGARLREYRLEAEFIRESVAWPLRDAQWEPDESVKECKQCRKEFSISRRKHHCRNCGDIYCNLCSNNTMPLPSSAKPVRVCDTCHTLLLKRYSAT